ncbi:MAG: hypothetical protein IKF80_04320 [Erysipelotrichaceae bacterium]|nr:hypothetical protein [Erysipelotrichaceae bacterium]
MMTETKIRIDDDPEIRKLIVNGYENSSKLMACRFAISSARDILKLIDQPFDDEIRKALRINDKWQNGEASISEVRKEVFSIHGLAKESDDPIIVAALRTVGHAIASAHMKEHALVAADYAIRVVNLLYPKDMEAVKRVRLIQLGYLDKK